MSVEAMIGGFDGLMASPGAHSRQSEQCILVRTAAWKALTSPSRTTARGSNGRAMCRGAAEARALQESCPRHPGRRLTARHGARGRCRKGEHRMAQ